MMLTRFVELLTIKTGKAQPQHEHVFGINTACAWLFRNIFGKDQLREIYCQVASRDDILAHGFAQSDEIPLESWTIVIRRLLEDVL
ncbi:hypothetical protein WR25_24177 [Diploscapter pachys]|uniref:Uncharacterized protein n=1 Tax=Diploscapter pachys TaxID=2018661 RepID=A0A2A2KZ51_9BILA|nr:hypothetical protein WR25_24177 [Diploscapter pachys]